jgi:hypothetical protein
MEIRKGLKWEFIIGGSLNTTKKTVLKVSDLLLPTINFMNSGEANIEVILWLPTIQTLQNPHSYAYLIFRTSSLC